MSFLCGSSAVVSFGTTWCGPCAVLAPELATGVGLNSVSSLLTVVVAGAAQKTYLWLHSTRGPTGFSRGPVTYNPVYAPTNGKSATGPMASLMNNIF